MKNLLLTGAILFAAVPLCRAQLKVDFDVVDGSGVLVANSITEFGFESFGATNQTVGQPFDLFRTVTFNTASWGNINVTLGSDANPAATNLAQVPRAIARTAGQVGAYNGIMPDLARDWVGIDSRPAGADATTLNVQISGLPAGNFELVSYHQDPGDQTGKFDVLVNGTQVATDLDIRGSAAGENPGAGNPPFFTVTPFTSDGSTPTTISFRLTTTNSASDSERIMVLNGFVLANQDEGLLVYSFNASPAPVFLGQNVTLSWVVRPDASVFIDIIGDVTPNTTDGVGSIVISPETYFASGTTNTITLTAQDTNTFEAENRSIQLAVLPDLASFSASPAVIHSGDTVTLSWLANPNASIVINQGIGSVNAQTDSNGNGSLSRSPTSTITYTMTVDRNGLITQTDVTVTVIPVGGTGTLNNGLIAYWPLDEVQGGVKTPEVVNGYDLNLEGSGITVTSDGYRSNAFSFSGSGLLGRAHAAGDLLPANKHNAFTVSFWTKANASAQDDRRVFAEGNTSTTTPLFSFQTTRAAVKATSPNKLGVYIRSSSNVEENFHTVTSAEVFESANWHHVVFVQNNGARIIYVDGVLDPIVIANAGSSWHTNAFSATSFGGLKRTGISHFFTGIIDDAAIWSRALTPAEIGELYLDGLDPNPGVLPLVINAFVSDFPAVVAGDTVRLTWDATTDATLFIDNGIGDVTAISSFGIGETNIMVSTPTTFTLTASRGVETPVTRIISIGIVSGVASGWHLLDNFETYQPGPVQGQANNWIQGAGLATVVDRSGNKVLNLGQTGAEIIAPGGLLAALPLSSLSVTQGQICTLFFRLYTPDTDPVSQLTAQAGMTDRPVSFIGHWQNNAGPYLRLEKPAALVTNISLTAPNGSGVARLTAPNTLDYGTLYNVWINVTNDVVASNDLFTVYIQAQGDAGRTLLFENLRGDRNPNDATYNPSPTLDKVFFALMNQNQGRDNLFIDDVYLSRGMYLDNVPAPPGAFAESLLLSDPRSVSGGFRFSWNSKVGATYTVRGKQNLTDTWQNLATGYPTGGATSGVTSYTDTDVSAPRKFYQAVAEPQPAIWSEDFEAGAAGWTVVDNSFGNSPTQWELGTPSNGPGSAHGGANAYGTDLDADYAQFTDTALRSPVIDLTTVTNQARLEFWHYLDVETTDYGQVNILDQFDGIIAQPAAQQSGSTGGWKLLSFPLPAAALGQSIKIEFRMVDADFSNAQSLPGWFIDDVAIR